LDPFLPPGAYLALIDAGDPSNPTAIAGTLVASAPLVLGALGRARSGPVLANIGAQGQFLLGATDAWWQLLP
jgi:ABC-type uncharacterized transport system permease subunit